MNIRPTMTIPFQNAAKLPATRPERIVKDAPPSREAATISATCLDLDEVNAFVNSGITAAAIVPQLMIAESLHQSSPISLISKWLTTKVTAMEITEVIHTRWVK